MDRLVFILCMFTSTLFVDVVHGGLVIQQPEKNIESARKTEYITITEHTPITRRRRDAVDHVVFPPFMSVKFDLRDQEVNLRLKPHEIMTPDIRLSDSDGPIEHDFARKAEVYEDEEKYASFVVACEDYTDKCSLPVMVKHHNENETCDVYPAQCKGMASHQILDCSENTAEENLIFHETEGLARRSKYKMLYRNCKRGSMMIDGAMWDISPDPDTASLHKAVQKDTGSKIDFGEKIPMLPKTEQHHAEQPFERVRRNSKDSKHRRHRRAIPNCDIVEMVAIVDESIWEFNFNQSAFNTTAAREAITAYYLALYLQADAHFKNIGLRRNNTCIRLYLDGIHIQTTTSDSWSIPNEVSLSGPPPDIAYVEAIGGLFTCGTQLNNLRSTYSLDLGQCFTRKDIVWNEGSGQPQYFRFYRSLGFREVCCDNTWTSFQGQVLEAYGDDVELLVAHEISHGLGGEDDDPSGCLDSDSYIMASEVEINTDLLKLTNVWHFSTCTVDQFYQHLDKFPTCLRTNNFTEAEFEIFQNKSLAGIQYDWDAQCLQRFGNGSKKCDPTGQNRTYFDDMCSNGIFCTEVEFGNGSCTGQTRPFDGTTCGTFGSYCLEGACFIQLGNGENCTSHVECGTNNSFCSYPNNTCQCADGFYDDNGATIGGLCVEKVSVGEFCPQSDACLDPNSVCLNMNCTCVSGYYAENGSCYPLRCVGEECDESYQCKGNFTECSGITKTCRCPTDRYLNITTGDCDRKKELGLGCEAGQCHADNSVCGSLTVVCECQEGFFDTDGAGTPGGNCTAKFLLGEMCTQPDSCADPVGICSSTCQCPMDFFNNNGTCERKKCVGETCFNATDCLGGNVECAGIPKVCQCPTGFYLNDTTASCDPKKDLGSACEDGECEAANSVCSSTTNQCVCQEGFFDTNGAVQSGGNCTAKYDLGESCTQSDSCADPVAICSTNCQCPRDFFNNNGICERKKCVGETCFNSTDCLGTNVECLGNPKLCQCPTGFYLNDTTADCDMKKDLGRTCEDGECGPANSVCSSTTNVCECQEGFYDTDGSGTAGGNCTAKLSLGESCMQSDSCADPVAICSTTCQCPTDFFNNNGVCERKKCVGETCFNSTDCLGTNVECLGSPKLCQCPTGFYLNDTTADCDMKKDLGQTCEDGECGPANSVCSSTTNLCECQEGFFDTDGSGTLGGNCSAKLSLGKSCMQSDSCADPVAICSTTCQCPKDFFNNNGVCERKKCVGETCFNSTDCLGTNVECLGNPKLCQCPTGFYLNDTTADCDMKKDLGRTCEDGECGPANSVCSSTTNVCECQEGFYDTGSGTPGGNCSAKLSLGESCTQSDSCADPVAICSTTCQCPTDFFNNNGVCERKKCVGESCFNSTDCLGTNVECLGNPKLCQCPTGFYLNDTTADCDMKKDLGRTCEDGECGPANSVCSSTTNVCECQEGFFDTDGSGTPGGNCSAKLSLGESCMQSDSCADPVAICSTTCQCPTDFFNNNGICERKKCVGETCFNSTDCLGTNVECLGSPKLCQCPVGFYLNDTTADCDMKKDLGRTCEDGECGPANSVCSSTTNVCECQEGFYDTDGSGTPGGNCTAKLSLGESCMQSDSCADPVAICSTTCQCPTDFFNNNGVCERKKCVGETCFNSTDCLGTNVECLGNPKLCQCPTGFYLNDTTADCDMKKDLGRKCEDGECGPANSVCSSTTNLCECQEGFFDTDGSGTLGGNCSAKLSLGESCMQSDSCADPVAICSTSCQCPTDFFNNNGVCKRKRCIGETCNNATDCFGMDVECLGSPKKCQCQTGFFLNDTTGDCNTKKALGESCSPGQCLGDAICNPLNQTCTCAPGFTVIGGNCSMGQVQVQCPTSDFVIFENSCYLFGTSEVLYNPARSFCDGFDGNGLDSRLVQVDTTAENDFLKEFASNRTLQPAFGYWNDLFQFNTNGNESWRTTGDLLTIDGWRPGRPNGNDKYCTVFSKRSSYNWIDVDCATDIRGGSDGSTYFPICEIDLGA